MSDADDYEGVLLDKISALRSANKSLINERLSLVKAVLHLLPRRDDVDLYVTESGSMTDDISEAISMGEEFIEITQFVREEKL